MKVLFLCVANSARSQMAEAMGNYYWGDDHQFYSAGSDPSFPHPVAVKTLEKRGISTSELSSKHYSTIDLEDMDYVITLCKEEYCPVVPGNKLHWPFADPSDDTQNIEAAFVHTAEKIKDRIEKFLSNNN